MALKFGLSVRDLAAKESMNMEVNSKQRKVIVAGMALIVAMALFPPWIYTFKYQSTYSENPAGYASIIMPPSSESGRRSEGVKVDLSRLLIQILAVSALTCIGFILSGHPNKSGSHSNHKRNC